MPWTFVCHDLQYKKKDPSVLYGDKIIMPTTVLEEIFNDEELASPYMFKIERRGIVSSQYCGVLEFSEDRTSVFLPEWMMRNLQVSNGGQVVLSIQKNIPKGKELKLKPSSMAFLDVAQELGVQHFLENLLRTYTILSTGEKISVYFNNEVYDLTVTELKPFKVCSIIDTDIEVIFDEPNDVIRPRSKDRRKNSVEDSKLNDSVKFDGSKTDELSSTTCSNGIISHGTTSLHKPLNKFQQKKLEQVFNSKGYKLNDDNNNVQIHPSTSPITTEEDEDNNKLNNNNNNNIPSEDSIQCKYCLTYIPKASFDLHDLHCFKNKKMHRKICEQCHEAVLVEDFDKNHIHCEDCGEVCTINTINEHINNQHAPVKCECGKNIPQVEYNKHILQECPKRKEICPYCKLPVEMGGWSEHIEICGSRTEKCGFCNEYIKLMDMEQHYNSNCTYGVKPKPVHDEFYQREHEIDTESDYFKMMSHITQASEFDDLLEASDYTNMLINGNTHHNYNEYASHPDDRPIHPVQPRSMNDAFIANSPIIAEDDPEIQKAIEESLKQDFKNDLPPIDSKPVSLVTGPTPGTKRNSNIKSKFAESKQSYLPPTQQPPPVQPYKNRQPPSHSNYLEPTKSSKVRVSSSRRDNTASYQPPPPQPSRITTAANGPKTPSKEKNTKARPRKVSSSGISGISNAVKISKKPPQPQPSSNPRYNTPPTRVTSSKSYSKGTVNPPAVVRPSHSQSSSNLNSYPKDVAYDEEDPELQMALQIGRKWYGL